MRTYQSLPWEATCGALSSTVCPQCDTPHRQYRRTFGHIHLDFMIAVLAVSSTEAVKKCKLRGITYTAKNCGHDASLWNLLEGHGELGRAGWSLTELGRLFLQERIAIPRYVVAGSRKIIVRYEGPAISRSTIPLEPPQDYGDFRNQGGVGE